MLQAASFMLRQFRSGKLGKINLDADQLPTLNAEILTRQAAQGR